MPQPDFFSILFVAIASLGVFCYIYGKRELEYRNLIFLGFAMRLFLLFADYYGWFKILNSGADTEMFHRVSAANVNSFAKVYRGGYTYFLTIVYQITGTSRLIAQFINVLFGMGIIFLCQRIMRELGVERRNMLYAMCVLVFLPNLNIFSAILLREAWVEYFVALSLFMFVRWFRSGMPLYIVGVVASVLAASYMHAGVIGLLMGYSIAFITYNPNTENITLSRNTIASVIFMLAVGVAASSYMELFTGKFAEYDSIDDIVEVTNRIERGSSDYLLWISSDSVAMSLMFAPLKMFYFLFSPLPTEWRRVSDILGFLLDGAIYMYLCVVAWRYSATTKLTKSLKKYLIAALLTVTFIFAYGTGNAGTAFRHRAKILPVIVMMFAVSTIKDRNDGEKI